MIACGNLANNRAIQRLYTARCCFVDTFFPGANGYLVKSISNPFGYGRNCIVAGASTEEALVAALGVFRDIVAASAAAAWIGFTPRLFDHNLPTDFRKPPRLDRMVRDDLEIWGTGWSASPFRGGRLLSYLWHYYLTDHPVWARAAVDILKGSIRTVARGVPCAPGGIPLFLQPAQLHIHLWDLVEDSPLFIPEDRLRAVTICSASC